VKVFDETLHKAPGIVQLIFGNDDEVEFRGHKSAKS
jgi:hypothetical protein